MFYTILIHSEHKTCGKNLRPRFYRCNLHHNEPPTPGGPAPRRHRTVSEAQTPNVSRSGWPVRVGELVISPEMMFIHPISLVRKDRFRSKCFKKNIFRFENFEILEKSKIPQKYIEISRF